MILVDEVRHYRGRIHNEWCHMVSDVSEQELHKMARKLQLRRSWFQRGSWPHYDLTPGKRRRAVEAGAAEVTTRELITQMRARWMTKKEKKRRPQQSPVAKVPRRFYLPERGKDEKHRPSGLIVPPVRRRST